MSGPRSEARHRTPSAVTPADGELLARHRGGDGAAFAELVARYRRIVYGYLVRCGVEGAARDDVFQEIFTSIHRAAATYRPERPLKPWVLTIVANAVRSHHRKARRPTHVLSPAEFPPDGSPTPDSHQLAEARETAAWIERAIAMLPISQREVVTLCCVEQLAQDNVAAALGMPVNTVKTHLRRARIALAQALARRTAAQRREVPQ